jgi:hypothetical protein
VLTSSYYLGVDPVDAMGMFEIACRKFTETNGIKPILIVEDLHSCKKPNHNSLVPGATSLASDLVRIHNDGFLNVVYTMSDFSGVGLLKSGKYNLIHC